MINIELFKKALEAEIKSGIWPRETDAIFALGLKQLSDFCNEISHLKMTERQENKLYEIAIGTIAAGMAKRDVIFQDRNIQEDEQDFKLYDWSEMYATCELDQLLDESKPFNDQNEKDKTTYNLMISASGEKILANKLPFDKRRLDHKFPQLENFFHNIEIRRNGEYKAIEDKFNEALGYEERVDVSTNDAHKKYMKTLVELKKHVLEQFQAGTKDFDFEKCLDLANRTEYLTNKLTNDQLAEGHLKDYHRANQTFFKTSAKTRTLRVILTDLLIIAAGIIGATVGFFVAGPVGAVAGFVAGLAVGAAATASSLGIYSIYARKSNPLIQLEDAAAEVVHSAPANS